MTAITRKEHIHTNTQTQNLLRELFAWSISGEVRILFGCTGNSGTGCMVFALYGPTHAFPAHRATPLFSDKSTLSSFPRYQETTGGKKEWERRSYTRSHRFICLLLFLRPPPVPPFFFFLLFYMQRLHKLSFQSSDWGQWDNRNLFVLNQISKCEVSCPHSLETEKCVSDVKRTDKPLIQTHNYNCSTAYTDPNSSDLNENLRARMLIQELKKKRNQVHRKKKKRI